MLFTSDNRGDLVFITVLPPEEQPGVHAIRSTYQELHDHVSEQKLFLFHDRVYGLVSAFDQIAAIREEVCSDKIAENPPVTFVEGRPAYQHEFAGIHAIAIKEDGSRLHSVQKNEQICGARYQGNEAEYLMLADIARLLPESAHSDRLTEAYEAIDLADEVLHDEQWSFKDVRRTWFYLDDILDWYGDFNKARNRIYHRIGFMNGSLSSVIPASTGIFGRSGRGFACTLDLLAMRPLSDTPFQIERMVNPRQNEALEYGSAFSRGIAVTTQSNKYFFLSGTASIDETGATIHPGDMRKQTRRTLANVASLLENAGGDLHFIQQATAFIKRPEDIPIFEEEIRKNGMSEIPIITTIADVCRDDLLFELDATAVMPHYTTDD